MESLWRALLVPQSRQCNQRDHCWTSLNASSCQMSPWSQRRWNHPRSRCNREGKRNSEVGVNVFSVLFVSTSNVMSWCRVDIESFFIRNNHFYLSACDVVPEPRLLGDELEEQKLSIDTESLPVLDFLINGGLHVGDSSKLMSWTSLLAECCGWWWWRDVRFAGGAGIFGGTRNSVLENVNVSLDLLLFFEAPKRFERILIDFWLPDFFTGAAGACALGGGGLGGAGFLFLLTVDAADALGALIWLRLGGGGAGRVGIVIVMSSSVSGFCSSGR